jgi:hypothetical protein
VTTYERARRRARIAVSTTVAIGLIALTGFGLELRESRTQSDDLRRALRAEQELSRKQQQLIRRQETLRVEARRTVCVEIENLKASQREDVQRRRAQTIEFLKANPEGTPGLPAEELEESLRNSAKTLRSLAPAGSRGQTIAEACDDFAHGRT